MSQLMLMDEGGKKFAANCLLFLSPEEIKCCRLVCKLWDNFIKDDDFWKSNRVRKELKQKLLQRWKTAEPMTKQLAEIGQRIDSIYCNDAHVFCGMGFNKVRVYDFATGQLSRELIQSHLEPDYSYSTHQVVGGKGVVAALMRQTEIGTAVTIWSSQGEMDQLHFFNCQNFHCPNDSCGTLKHFGIETIQVVGKNKVAILSHGFKASLVVLEKGDHTWDTKVLDCFALEVCSSLAYDGDWLAVLDWHNKTVKLWRGNEDCQDVAFPGISLLDALVCMFIQLPHFILGKRSCEGKDRTAQIMVYKMEDTVPCLVKCINLDMRELNFELEPIANEFCVGFMERIEGGTIVHQFMRTELVAVELSPDETERREIIVEGDHKKVSINSTCFLATVRRQNHGSGWRPTKHDLWKNDLWMSNNIL